MTKKRGSKAAISSTPTSKPLHIIDPRPSTIATDEQMRALRSEGELYYWGKVEPAQRFDLPNTNFGLLRDPTLPKYEDIAIELYNLKNPTKKTEVIKEPTQLSSPSNEILEDHVRRNKEFALKTLKENQEYKTKLQQKNEELEQLTKKMEDRFAVITASLEQHRCVIENLTEENNI
ncbi:hypothetical protein C9374_002528 [Naegleria lovaniensis]|uniref:Uncharacterized protein n=1 Tax=Naegleria lovaniensis TaxID=51637 RepID=A0AA88KQ60_NAELO|nr:uncharacterized protein C9374_002528 [Naegleria lovaniensis]KAG2386082.1 hypothetical protein C9374_002528 [Naegleria lovaniensis]